MSDMVILVRRAKTAEAENAKFLRERMSDPLGTRLEYISRFQELHFRELRRILSKRGVPQAVCLASPQFLIWRILALLCRYCRTVRFASSGDSLSWQ
jgi:hypothetical protein